MSKRYKNLLAVLASLGIAATPLLTTSASATSFTDISSAGSWAQASIQRAAALGLMNGDPNGNFRPLDTLTRQEVAKVLVSALNLPVSNTATSSFQDVSTSDWGQKYIEAIAKTGIMTGDGNGHFRPNDPITREELAVVLIRSLHVGYYGQGANLTVADKNSIDSWAKDYVAVAIKYGLMKGDGVNFDPKQLTTRQEVAVTVVNYVTVKANLASQGNGNSNGNGDGSSTGTDSGSGSDSDTGSDTTDGTGFDSSVPGQSPVIPGEVTALNPNEIRVTFPQAVYQPSALNVNNYTLVAGGRHIKNIVMGSNSATVLLQLDTPLTNGSTYQVNVQNVANSSYQTIAPYVDSTHLFGDTIKPSLTNASVVGNQVKLQFNKPVQNNMIVKIDDVIVADGNTTKVTSTGAPGDYTVLTPAITNQALINNTYHTVKVYSATDYDVPANLTTIQSRSFYGTAQSTPTVTAVTPLTQNTFRITFSQQLAAPLAPSNLIVKQSNVNYSGVLSVSPDSSDPTGLSYVVTVNSDSSTPLYLNNANTAYLSVQVSGYQNTVNVVGSPYYGAVYLSRPANPAIVTGMNTISGHTLTLQFNEPLDPLSVGDYSKITVTSSGNIQDPVSSASVSGDKLVLTLTQDVTPGTYSIVLPAGMISDQNGHQNLAATSTVTYAQTPYLYIQANQTPGVVNEGEAGIASGDVDIVTINYGVPMNSAAAYSYYYHLDGNPLPAGTTVAFSNQAKTAVQIKFPAGSFARDTQSMLTIDKTVTAQNGQIVETAAGGTDSMMLGFTGNTQPVLKGAQFKLQNPNDTSTDQLLLTFSEPLNNAGDSDDYKITLNNVNTPLTYTNAATGAGNTVVLTLANPINISQSLTVQVNPVGATTNPTMTAADANGNKLYGGTYVTVSGVTN